MISEKDIPALYQKLKPQIARDFRPVTVAIVAPGSTTSPNSVPWSSINFAGSSLADIASRNHNLLTGRDNDDHLQYVRQAGRSGVALIDVIARVRSPLDTRYRGDIAAYSTGLIINSYDDTAAAYLPLEVDASTIKLYPSANAALGLTVASTGSITAAPGTATAHQFGYGTIGEMGYGSLWAGFAHSAMASVGNYALLQDSSGNTVLNSAAGSTVTIRQNNANRISFGSSSLWYSGLATLNTDNYASQLTGMHLGYDGSIDCRYLFTDQLHAKAFIADLEQALAGGQIISKSVTILHSNFTAPFPGLTSPLVVKDLPSAHGMQVFQANDFIRLRTFSRSGGGLDISDCWGQVTSPSDNADGTQNWTFTRTGTATYNTISFIAASSQSNTSSVSVIPSKPTGTLSGHLMLATVGYTGSPTVTEPSGWLPILTQAATGITQKVYYKIAGGSEPASYTWTFSPATNASASIATYSGAGFVVFIDTSSSQANSGTTSMSAPTVTPRTAADMLVFCGATANVRATPPAGMTERADAGVTAAGSYIADVLLSSGSATGTKTATLASSSNSAAAQILLMASYSALSTEAGAMAPLSTVEADAIVLDYGVSGNGYAEVNAIDGIYGANSPYYQIVTWTTHPTNVTLRMRLGNLSGVTDSVFGSFSGVYGLYTSNGYFKGKAAFGSGSNIILDSNGAAITLNNDITWGVSGSIATYKTVSIDSYQSYAFKDSSTYVAGLGGGKSTNKDVLILYNQQHDVDKEASVIIDSRFSSTGAGPTYDRPARLTLATSRWFPTLGVQHAATLEILSTSGNDDRITLTADAFYLNTTMLTANSGALAVAGNTTITGTLSATSSFGATKATLAPSSSGDIGLQITPHSSATADAIRIDSADTGASNFGPFLSVGRNTNASGAGGWIRLYTKSGSTGDLWVDNSGNVRVGAATGNSNDTGGTVVGTQSSSLTAKNIIGSTISPRDALMNILAATKALRRFTYKNGSFDNQEFDGVVIDYAPRYGMDNGKSLNSITLFNDLILSIQALSDRLEKLENN